MSVTVIQDQVLIGTVLGGSSLMKPAKGANYYLSMRGKDKLWLAYKMAEMPSFFKALKFYQYGGTYRCNSICSSIITDFYQEMYEGKQRKVAMDLLNRLMDIGIAIWYLESGSKTGRGKKNAYINTTKFGKDGTKIVCQYFNEVGMSCNVNRSGNRSRVLFTLDGTTKLFYTIANKFPPFMYHKL